MLNEQEKDLVNAEYLRDIRVLKTKIELLKKENSELRKKIILSANKIKDLIIETDMIATTLDEEVTRRQKDAKTILQLKNRIGEMNRKTEQKNTEKLFYRDEYTDDEYTDEEYNEENMDEQTREDLKTEGELLRLMIEYPIK